MRNNNFIIIEHSFIPAKFSLWQLQTCYRPIGLLCENIICIKERSKLSTIERRKTKKNRSVVKESVLVDISMVRWFISNLKGEKMDKMLMLLIKSINQIGHTIG